jgi:putative DNA primase/helicase
MGEVSKHYPQPAGTRPKEERDKTLDTRLQQELPGILAWAIWGCLEWQRLGELKEPEAVLEATAGYQAEMDTLGRFLDECCLINADVRVKMGSLYDAYTKWCESTRETPISLTAMGQRLDDKGYAKHTSNYVWRLGLALKDQKGP